MKRLTTASSRQPAAAADADRSASRSAEALHTDEGNRCDFT